MASSEFPLRKKEALNYIYVDIIEAKGLLLLKYNKVRRSFRSD
jgi:hypothetical protein